MTENGATTTSGDAGTPENPCWFKVPTPTSEQVAAAKTVGHKTYDVDDGKWYWWLEYDKNVLDLGINQFPHSSHLYDYSVTDQNLKNMVPSILEREDMRNRGREAISKFLTGLTIEPHTRAKALKHLAEIEAVVDHGDLRAALEVAKISSMDFHYKGQLVKQLHLALIYFPDFADREEETYGTARMIIEHHQPKPASEVIGSSTEGA